MRTVAAIISGSGVYRDDPGKYDVGINSSDRMPVPITVKGLPR